jgi:hypothetical protein
LYPRGNSLGVSKEGYYAVSRQAAITGDTQFDIELIRR